MGKVVERLRLTSFSDPKRTVVVEAVVDTGATMIVLPMAVVRKLRLRKSSQVGVRYAPGRIESKGIYGVVTAEIRGRSGHFDVLAEEKGAQPLIGQIVLEQLDLIVDPKRRCLAPNPQSPDVPMVEVLGLDVLRSFVHRSSLLVRRSSNIARSE